MIDTTDRAFLGDAKMSMGYEPTYSGATSLFRRRYSRNLKDVDIAAWGVPFDLSVTNRPGCRFGPRAIRDASTNLAWDGGPWPWGFDPFERLTMVDYGDCSFDPGFPMEIVERIHDEALAILETDLPICHSTLTHLIQPLRRARAHRSAEDCQRGRHSH